MRFPTAVLTLAVSLPMMACSMEVEGEEEADVEEAEVIAFNKMTNVELIANSLVGTVGAMDALTGNALDSDLFADDGPLPDEMNDPHSEVFLKYLVECALTTADTVTYTTYANQTRTVRGKHGLCPEWADGEPSQECLDVVAGCLLTRNNAEGVEVRVSLRGPNEAGIPLPTSTTVPVKTTDETAATINSFKKCAGAQNGPARDCGYATSPSLVGTCTPGNQVSMSCSVGSTQFVTRVCDGPEGCNHASPRNLGEGTVCGNGAGAFSFTCGADGAFSAMVGPVTAGQSLGGGFKSAAGGVFPANERSVWSVEEGTFMGSFLRVSGFNSALPWTRSVDSNGIITFEVPHAPGVDQHPYLDSFACSHPDWTAADALMANRLCAIDVVDPDGNQTNLCVAEHLGACHGGADPICLNPDAPPIAGDGDNGQCEANYLPRTRPMTSFLHQPCDLVPPGLEAICERRSIIR